MSIGLPRVRLGEVLSKTSEPHTVKPDQEYPNFGIFSFGRGLFAKPPISGMASRATTLFRVRQGQFIYSRLFAFEGAYGLVTSEFDGCYVSNEYPAFDCDRSRLVPEYLGLYFKRPSVWKDVAQVSTGIGDRRRRIQPDDFLTHCIALPPVPEQQRIVSKVDALAKKIEEAKGLRWAVGCMANSLLRSVFAGLIAKAAYQPMNAVAPLVRRPVQIDPGGQYPELGIRSFGKGTFHKPALSGLEVGTKKLYQIEPGDLVFGNVFAWEGAVAVARPEDLGRFGSHRFITCVANPEKTTAPFLRFYFLTEEGLAKLGKASPGGAGRNRTLGLDALGSIRVPIIPLTEQTWFDRLQESVEGIFVQQAQSEAELDALLPSILDKAFCGEL